MKADQTKSRTRISSGVQNGERVGNNCPLQAEAEGQGMTVPRGGRIFDPKPHFARNLPGPSSR